MIEKEGFTVVIRAVSISSIFNSMSKWAFKEEYQSLIYKMHNSAWTKYTYGVYKWCLFKKRESLPTDGIEPARAQKMSCVS